MSPSLTKAEAARLTKPSGAALTRRKKRPRPEKAIQRAILDFLATIPGIYVFKTGTGMFPMTYKGKTRMVRMGTVGVADIVGWRAVEGWGPSCNCPATGLISHKHRISTAHFLAIEVKRPGELPTREQAAFLERVRSAGGIAIVAHSVDDVVSALGLAPRKSAAVAAP